MATFRKRGSRWHVQVRRRGKKSQTKSFATRAEAKKWAYEAEVLLAAKPAALEPTEPLMELLSRYEREVTSKKRGASEERYRLHALIRHPIAETSISELTTAKLAAYRDERAAVVTPESVRRELGLLRHCLALASSEWGYPIKVNPVSVLRLPPSSSRRERRLVTEEEARLFAACGQSRNRLLLPIVSLALQTGLRRKELLELRWADLSIAARSLLVREGKNGCSRTIPLTRRAVEILQNVRKDRDRIFPLSPNAVRLAWERVRRRAGLENLRFHDLRHEALSRFFEMGLTTPEVASISGHRDIRMLMRYTHPLRQRIIEQMDKRDARGAS